MVAQNSSPAFAAIMDAIQDKFQEEAESRENSDTGSEVIMDGIILFEILLVELLNDMGLVLEILIHYICHLKLKKKYSAGRTSNLLGLMQ